jgi:hypothetical protein
MGLAISRVVQNGIVISEYAAPASAPKGNVTMYADLTGGHNASVVILNPNSSPVLFNTRLWTLSNQQLDFRQRSLPALGQITLSINEVFPAVPAGFKGLLGVEAVSGFLNVVALRTLQNERGEILTTTMPLAETQQPAPTPVVFPQIAEGNGYTTEIILINPDGHEHSAAIIGLYADDERAFQISPGQ